MPEPESESNKYNRNVLLVLDCVINGMRNLFSDQEFKFYESYKSMSPLAQTIFARTITRKRIWYVVDDHLSSYAPDKVKDETKEKDLD